MISIGIYRVYMSIYDDSEFDAVDTYLYNLPY